MTSSVAEEAGTTTSAGNNSTYSDRRCGENKCSSDKRTRAGDRGF